MSVSLQPTDRQQNWEGETSSSQLQAPATQLSALRGRYGQLKTSFKPTFRALERTRFCAVERLRCSGGRLKSVVCHVVSHRDLRRKMGLAARVSNSFFVFCVFFFLKCNIHCPRFVCYLSRLSVFQLRQQVSCIRR